jgi:hypothetical protein
MPGVVPWRRRFLDDGASSGECCWCCTVGVHELFSVAADTTRNLLVSAHRTPGF